MRLISYGFLVVNIGRKNCFSLADEIIMDVLRINLLKMEDFTIVMRKDYISRQIFIFVRGKNAE